MKKLLLTGFEPFLHYTENPTTEIVKYFHQRKVNDYHIKGKVLPVQFEEAGRLIITYIHEYNPDIIISLGIAKGRSKVTPERIAINCNDGHQDNAGYKPMGEKIYSQGPDGLFSTLPNKVFVKQLNNNHLPAKISNSAGTYLCNHVMYHSLYHIHKNNLPTKAGFIHLPISHQLVKENEDVTSWSYDDLLESVRICINSLT